MTVMDVPLIELAKQLRSGAVKARTLMEQCAENYHRTEHQLNAYKTWGGEQALHVADCVDQLINQGYDLGPLMGLPISIKDMFGVNGMPTYAGTSSEIGGNWAKSGTLIQAITQQLAPITGKSHTVELAFGGVGINEHWGTPWNPWDTQTHRVPGGSSSGAGVSLCQGSALLALGTDTAGSVRIPASVTGKVALKTTISRWPTNHTVPLSSTLDTPGLLANSIADLTYGYCAVESRLRCRTFSMPQPRSINGLRIGIPEHFFWDDISPSIAQVVDQAGKQLEEAGAVLVPVTIPNCAEVYEVFQAGGVAAAELAQFIQHFIPEKQSSLGELVALRIDGAAQLSAIEYLKRLTLLKHAAVEVQTLFMDVDVCVTPTVAITPPKVQELTDLEQYRRANMLMLRNTSIANLMNLTAITLPIGLDNMRMPVGLQWMGPPNQELELLAIALGAEQLFGTPRQALGQMPAW